METFAETLVLIGGVYHLAFAVFHLFFAKLFRWKQELQSLSAVNRAVMQVLNLCLMFLLLVAAYVSLFHHAQMVATDLGQALLAGFAAFWILRALEQVLFFRIKHPASLAFTLVFLAGGLLYLLPFVWSL